MLEISTAKIYCFSEMTKCLVDIYVFFYSFTLVWQINMSLLYNRIQDIFSSSIMGGLYTSPPMRYFCPSAIFDYLGGQMGDKTGENLQISKLKVKNLQK